MVRPDDGVDLGVWKSIAPSVLLVPVDTHLYKLSRNLGFTARTTLTWDTTEEVTAALRRIDPADPVRFDFSLCHLGMLQRCPSRRDEARCEGCGIKNVCRHWAKPQRQPQPKADAKAKPQPKADAKAKPQPKRHVEHGKAKL
jgi:hypothetical protein